MPAAAGWATGGPPPDLHQVGFLLPPQKSMAAGDENRNTWVGKASWTVRKKLRGGAGGPGVGAIAR